MRLIFVRHGDPDYAHDSLTEKGFREAALLAQRVKKWDVTDFYVSPLGRAQRTAQACLDVVGRSAETLPWLREFHAPINDPMRGEHQVCWDLYPSYWTKIAEMYDKEAFATAGIMNTGDVAAEYKRVCAGMDALLARYGYVYEDGVFRTDRTEQVDRDATIVLFCHMGVTLFLMSHLFGISPVVMTTSFFFAPTSVTVLSTEEREEGTAFFRCQKAGDTSHLENGEEPVSSSGYFTDAFQEI